MKVLVTGARGMLGRAVVRIMRDEGFTLSSWDMEEGDLSDSRIALEAIETVRPQVLVNCAAFTRVDECEDPGRKQEVWSANVTLPANLAALCARFQILMVHISTDYVFDGNKKGAYVETDGPNPLSVYGRSKWEGELAVMKAHPEGCALLRSAWLYGPGGKNFVDTIREKAREEKRLLVVEDQVGSPTRTADLARAVVACVRSKATGVFHAVNAGSTTWYGLAKKIVALVGPRDVVVEPCPASRYPSPAPRPKNSRLRCDKLARSTNFVFRPWEEALEEYLLEAGENDAALRGKG